MTKKSKSYHEHRPWGGFTQFTHNEISTVKILKVKPGQKNSLQFHHKREELWIPLNENCKVTVGNKTWQAKQFEEVFIGKNKKHRLAGIGKKPGYVLEISFGHFDENDIVRVEDDYGRA